MKSYIYYSLILLFCFSAINAQGLVNKTNYFRGLTFKSHEVNKDERTSLDITPNGGITFKDGFTLEFDLKLYVVFHSYGYVFRIISDNLESLDLTSNVNDNKLNIILNGPKQTIVSSELIYKSKDVREKWAKVSVRFEAERIVFRLNNEEIILNSSFSNLSVDKIYFGANRHKLYYTSDVPPMSIRDVIIKDNNGNVVRSWEMAKHGKDAVYDEVGAHKAVVRNGIWEINKHSEWAKITSMSIKSNNVQVATDSIHGRVFVTTRDSLYVISLTNRSIKAFNPKIVDNRSSEPSYLVYDYQSDRLISYNNNEDKLIFYDFVEDKWSDSALTRSLLIRHHNRFIDEQRRQLVTFGGYGMYRYNSQLMKHSLDGGDWTIHDFKKDVMPRYLSSMGYMGDGNILIFGGYGSVTGEQEASAHNTFDIVQIDTRKNAVKRVGELSGFQEHYTFGNSMIFNSTKSKFYTLAYMNDLYKSSIRLFEVNLDNMQHRFIGDSIPYNFQDTESFCDLFLYKDSCMYAVVVQKVDNKVNVSVHSLLYPPLSKDEIWQSDKGNNSHLSQGKIFAILFLVATSAILAVIYFRRKRQIHQPEESNIPVNEDILNLVSAEEQVSDVISTKPKEKKSVISLLGGFQIFDKNGNDITGQFTPVIRQMFLFCLLEYITTGKGVTSERLEELFWYDMDKAKAINNRNVNIRKLRLLLQEVGDISLQKNSMYWQVDINKGVYCDYTEVMSLLTAVNKDDVSAETIDKIIDIASAGTLLPNYDAEWVDRYKSSYSTLLVNVLLGFARKQIGTNIDLQRMIRLADVILIHDSIDEDSIKIKCRSLYQLGQKGLSKRCYDKFCTDYTNILNEAPQMTYDAMINSPLSEG